MKKIPTYQDYSYLQPGDHLIRPLNNSLTLKFNTISVCHEISSHSIAFMPIRFFSG